MGTGCQSHARVEPPPPWSTLLFLQFEVETAGLLHFILCLIYYGRFAQASLAQGVVFKVAADLRSFVWFLGFGAHAASKNAAAKSSENAR